MLTTVSLSSGITSPILWPARVIIARMDKILIVPGASSPSLKIEYTPPRETYLQINPWDLLGISKEDYGWLKLAESAFAFWNNEDDARFDNL